MKNILLPTDFSENAWNAIQYAFDMLKDDSCNLYLFNSYNPPGMTATTVSSSKNTKIIADLSREQSLNGLEETSKRIEATFKGHKHNITVLNSYNSFVSGVKEVIEKYAIDLIVMGTKGASGVKELFIGSNTAGVIANIKVTTLIIPEKAMFHSLREVTFATEYHHYWLKEELQPLLDIAKRNKATISILHALESRLNLSPEQEAIKKHLDLILENYDYEHYQLSKLSLESSIRAFIESRKTDMLCMLSKHHNFFQRIFGKSRVEEISFFVKIPFLVLHEQS